MHHVQVHVPYAVNHFEIIYSNGHGKLIVTPCHREIQMGAFCTKPANRRYFGRTPKKNCCLLQIKINGFSFLLMTAAQIYVYVLITFAQKSEIR